MRILVVASTFPASDTDPVPAFVKDQVIALKKEYPDLELFVLAPHDVLSNTKDFTEHPQYSEFRFHYFWPRRFEKLAGRGIMPTLQKNPAYYAMIPFLILGEFFALFRLTQRLKPDVIYAHWFTPQSVTAGLVSMLTMRPFVYTTHSSDVLVWRKIPLVGGMVVRFFTKRARAITAVSSRSLKKLRSFFNEGQWHHVKDKVAIIPMGTYLNLKSAAQKTKSGKNILFVGRLAEKKGVQYLLPAFAKTLTRHPTARLTVAGDGPWREKLEAQAKELKLGKKVGFVGYVTARQRTDLLSKADLFVLPSIIADSGDAEGLPVTLMEALAAGKVCVATRESGADDILSNGVTGFLVPQKKAVALCMAMDRALQLPPAKRRAMQAATKKLAAKFDWPTVAARHYNHLFLDKPPR